MSQTYTCEQLQKELDSSIIKYMTMTDDNKQIRRYLPSVQFSQIIDECLKHCNSSLVMFFIWCYQGMLSVTVESRDKLFVDVFLDDK